MDKQPDRRKYPRVKVRVPVGLRREGSTVPMGAATSDMSLGGCYIEMMFSLAKDTKTGNDLFGRADGEHRAASLGHYLVGLGPGRLCY